MPTSFSSLTIESWRQFSSVQIVFHNRLTIITGENGAGKSTILNILTRHIGSERPYLSVPLRASDGTISYLAERFRGIRSFASRIFDNFKEPSAQEISVGAVIYSNDQRGLLSVPASTSATYGISIRGQQEVRGVAVPSHRSLSLYQPVQTYYFSGVPPEEAYGRLFNEINSRYLGNHTGSSPIFRLKEILASWAAVGEGNSTIQGIPKQYKAYKEFVKILRTVLPETLGFRDISIRNPELVLVTESGDFMLDAVSGGISSIIETAAMIYFFSLTLANASDQFTVVMDEPENHLHPSLQRALLPSLISAFPNAQFIVATHSPFIVSSQKESRVYVLKHERSEQDDKNRTIDRKVRSYELDYINKAGSASDLLKDVLGVSSTMPIWVEDQLSKIAAKYTSADITSDKLGQLKHELSELGMGELFPEALVTLSKNNRQ